MTDQDKPAPDEGAQPQEKSGIRRKDLLKAALVAAPLPLLVGGAAAPVLARDRAETGGELTPTPEACDPGDPPTRQQTEGPYFKPNSPQRTSLVDPGTPGTRLTVSGYVFGLTCQPIANALLDFWQADVNGAYDNTGYRFRGHQYSDAQGRFSLQTIVPGLYPGRTRHIHVKVQAPNNPILTTQLYFPNEPRNNTDTIFHPSLVMTVRDVGGGREGTFDFVLNVRQNPDPPDPPGGTWAAGTPYRPGDTVTYGGVTYRCLQAHTASSGWEPPNVPALWQAA
ncbi:dioxygenase family protein [Streptomyces sp. CMB-StM0423]|uniref:dioxygenase family protein n=1 Tax=Streptomyces sp. CMB-StM0423 TaxID=2059884 RepID=UPI000C7140F3|nr:carbohydrate-binding protein [Streptomyces sp. CMB-StM0423]AUH39041.1 dioxygenase [Streptomyces sp. CMB-StM0423]